MSATNLMRVNPPTLLGMGTPVVFSLSRQTIANDAVLPVGTVVIPPAPIAKGVRGGTRVASLAWVSASAVATDTTTGTLVVTISRAGVAIATLNFVLGTTVGVQMVVTLSLLTGAVGVPVFAGDSITAAISGTYANWSTLNISIFGEMYAITA